MIHFTPTFRHPVEKRDPAQTFSAGVDTVSWIPAFAGMTLLEG